jgi:TldD protein
MMQDWANWSIETALRRGATYADARVMDIRQRDLSTKNGEVGTLVEGETLGIGIRVIVNGSWGFASTDLLTREGVQACAAQAVAIAKASSLAKKEDVALAPEKAYVDTWQNPFPKIPSRFPSKSRSACCSPPTPKCNA